MSMVEITSSMVVGFVIAMCLTRVLFPVYGADVSWGSSFNITAIFTVVSFVRGYLVRRFFNWVQIRWGK